ncbi:hypothetical protein [Parasphaerochaeta coccoides]|uniref:Uncharacterized protein n=1 Tax=Parasphaerochaeta coccoides (strain ATCC BAA-1237 / DSM 17374 / SPN1) TaxID=760011 RepID=F4GIM0_PARC1|nr:hypothetical protein [Parasphaerochaeta coccoides]AEC02154.1 hypothetical protein Spico_0930 [Parasphaerochaeta coccoides DSM 17374]
MSTLDNLRLLEERIKKAKVLIATLRREKFELQQKLELVETHNKELEEYSQSFRTSSRLLEASIANALETLSSIDGLDAVDLYSSLAQEELAAVEDFTTGAGISLDDIDLQDLSTEDSPLGEPLF